MGRDSWGSFVGGRVKGAMEGENISHSTKIVHLYHLTSPGEAML